MPVTITETFARLEAAKSERTTFDIHWQELALLCLPTRDFLRQLIPQGEKRTNFIFNATAPNAVDSLAAAMYFTLTNPSDRWFNLELEAVEPDDVDQDARDWLFDTTTRALNYLATPLSGFPMAAYEVYQDLAAFGSSVCQAGPPRNGRLRFVARALAGTYYLDDDEGEISDVFRIMDVRLRHLARMFQLDPQLDRMAADAKGGEEKMKLIHHVWDRGAESDPYSPSNLAMRWGSRYCLDGEKRSELSVSGFRRNPYLTPRWSKTAEETYGRGPAMSVLPDIKMVNRMSKDQAQAGAMKTRPPVNVWDASVKRKQLNLDPGGINTLNSTARFPPTFMQTGADPAAAQAMIEHTEAKIEKAFYLDMLELPLVRRSHSAMTAEEIMARRQQAFARAAPITGRLQGEWCQPAVERTVMWQLETGKLLPVPASLRGRSIKPVFTSPLAQSQRQRESDNLVETIQQALPVLGLDPGASMNIDADKALRAIWGNRNADPRILRRPRVVAGMKEREAEQQALAQGAATAKDLASAAKDASAAQLPAA